MSLKTGLIGILLAAVLLSAGCSRNNREDEGDGLSIRLVTVTIEDEEAGILEKGSEEEETAQPTGTEDNEEPIPPSGGAGGTSPTAVTQYASPTGTETEIAPAPSATEAAQKTVSPQITLSPSATVLPSAVVYPSAAASPLATRTTRAPTANDETPTDRPGGLITGTAGAAEVTETARPDRTSTPITRTWTATPTITRTGLPAAPDAVVAVPLIGTIILDGSADEEAWQDADETSFQTVNGRNLTTSTVSVRALYDEEEIYFLFTWGDQPSGTPEDGIALLWTMDNSITNFTSLGCFIACHGFTEDRGMYTNAEGEQGDLWYWRVEENREQVMDGYLDNTRPNGIKEDPSQEERRTIPGASKPPDGEDLETGWQYVSGHWTLEIRRSRLTGSAYDVQFDDLDKQYRFGLARFHEGSGPHGFQIGASRLRFRRGG